MARAVLGRVLVFDGPEGRVAGRVVEVEAYRGRRDPASHAHRGPTARNAVMFGRPGHAYVYFTYGMHHCLNLVSEPAGSASAVLIRALEPLEGLDLMRRRRARSGRPARRSGTRAAAPSLPADPALMRGPGNVARALGLTREHDGLDLTRGPLWLSDRPAERGGRRIVPGTRIGIRTAVERPWRFHLKGHPSVSGSGVRERRSGARRPLQPRPEPDRSRRDPVPDARLHR